MNVTNADNQEVCTERNLNFFHPSCCCPIRDVISRLGDKWSLLILTTINVNGTMRFGEIRQSIGDISHRMLTVTLRALETDGLLERKVHAEVPPRVEYSITPLGRSLMPHVKALVGWAQEQLPRILENRAKHNRKSEKPSCPDL